MKDPTRIPQLMTALQRAWEGQPDLELPQFLGMIANRGISWGSSEEELREVLEQLHKEHPSLIDASSSRSHYLLRTYLPDHLITLSAGTIVVRSAIDADNFPGVWSYSSMRRTGPGLPLVVTDTHGVDHRLGIVGLITALDPHDAPDLLRLKRGDLFNYRWLVVLADHRRALVGPRIRVWDQLRRAVEKTSIAWEELRCVPGEDLVVRPTGGGKDISLGRVESIILLEA